MTWLSKYVRAPLPRVDAARGGIHPAVTGYSGQVSSNRPASAKSSRSTPGRSRETSGATAGKPDKATVPGPRPRRLAVAALLTAAEGLVLAGAGIYVLVMGLIGAPESLEQAEMLGVTVLALAVIPTAAARGVWLRRSWSRGPAMITQLMALPVAWTLFQNGGGLIAAGLVTATAAIAVLALLINPTATEALGIGR